MINNKINLKHDIKSMLFLLFPVISLATSITTENVDPFAVNSIKKHPILRGSGSINFYSQLYLSQIDVESGLVGATYNFYKTAGWGFGFRPEYNLKGHLFSVQFEYINRILHYSVSPLGSPYHDSLDQPYPLVKNYRIKSNSYFAPGLGYGYRINVKKLMNLSIEIHLSDRIQEINEFYLTPYLSFSIKGLGVFFKENIRLNIWEISVGSEKWSSVIGINYQIRFFR